MRPSRREFLIGSAGIGMASALPLESASATPAMLEEAIRNVIGEANVIVTIAACVEDVK